MTGGTLFEELGFYYVGPIDGHNLDHLLPVLKNVARQRRRPDAGPCRDPEGQGLSRRPRPRADKYHGVVKFDVVTGAQAKAPANAPTYTKVFAESLIAGGREDDRDRRHHRGHAVGHRPRPVRRGFPERASSMSASPSSTP